MPATPSPNPFSSPFHPLDGAPPSTPAPPLPPPFTHFTPDRPFASLNPSSHTPDPT